MARLQRGQLAIAADLESKGHVAQHIAVPPEKGGIDDAAKAIAGEFRRTGDYIGKLADHAAQIEGQQEGRLAGMDPEFRTRNDLTIRGEAFDRAGLHVAETRLKTEIETQYDALHEKNRDNPTGLAQGLQAVNDGLFRHVPAELKPELELAAKRKGLALMRDVTREHVARTRAEELGALQMEMTVGLKGLTQRAYALGLDETADQALDGDLASFQKALGRTGLDGKPLMAPAAASKLLEHVKREATEARLYGAFERLDGTDAKQAFIGKIEEDFRNSQGLAAQFDLDGFRSIRAHLTSELRRSDSQKAMAVRALGGEIDRVARLAEKGYAVPTEEAAALRARAGGVGAPDLEQRLDAAEAALKWQRAARTARPEELDGFVHQETARLKAEGASEGAVARVELATKLAAEARRELKADPLGWADRVGVVKLTPVDFSSQQATNASVTARIAAAEEVARYYGVTPQYLRPDERQRLGALMAKGGNETIGIASAIAEAGGRHAPAILGELGKNAPTLALLGGHVAEHGVTPLARDAADGIALMRTEEGRKHAISISKTEQMDRARTIHQGAFGENSQTLLAALDLTNAAYFKRHVSRGRGDVDWNSWMATFREVVGEHQADGKTYGGVAMSRPGILGRASAPVIVPPNVEQAGFRDLVGSLSVDDFGVSPPRYESGEPVLPADLKRAWLQNVGAGRYRLNVGDTDRPMPLLDDEGNPFVLDMKAMEPTLRRRRPDLYIDGGEAPLRQSPAGPGYVDQTLQDRQGALNDAPPVQMKGRRPGGMMRLGGPMPQPDGGSMAQPVIFTGENSQTANHETLSRARELERSNASPDEIWQKAGWMRNKDGKWVEEIDDSNAKLKIDAGQLTKQLPAVTMQSSTEEWGKAFKRFKLDQVLNHPDLFKAYPELRNLPVDIFNSDVDPAGNFASFVRGDTEGDGGERIEIALRQGSGTPFMGVLMHEVQHAVRKLYGGSFGNADWKSEDEVEARNTSEKRLGWSRGLRRMIPPNRSQDTPWPRVK